jgi:hypothetical protein
MDDVFLKANFTPTGVTPSAAIAHLFEVKHYLFLCTALDPDTLALRNVMLTFNGREWMVTSQTPNLTYIGSQKRGSQFYAWGTDGQALYPLFTQVSNMAKRLDTKLFGANNPAVTKEVFGFYMQAQDQSAAASGVSATITYPVSGIATQVAEFESVPSQVYTVNDFNSPGVTQQVVDLMVADPSFPAPSPSWPLFGTSTGGIPAVNVGVRLTTTSQDFILAHMLLAYREGPAVGGG